MARRRPSSLFSQRPNPAPLEPERWIRSGACADKPESIELFFGREGEGRRARQRRERQAARLCAACPVRQRCEDYAMALPERYGVWGGLGEEMRADIRRERRNTIPAAA